MIKRIGSPDNPIPSTRELAKYCYIDYLDIIKEVKKMTGIRIKNLNLNKKKEQKSSDQPNKNFMGPF